jgi:hypothetical protein
LGERLVVVGQFTKIDGDNFGRVAMWDGTNWHSFPSIDNDVFACGTWDPDGDGPAHSRLIISGGFKKIGTVTFNYVAMWDGAAWVPMARDGGITSSFTALCNWDPDGDGPLPVQLIAAGTPVSVWDGVSWKALPGPGLTGPVWSVTTWDPDGEGPLPRRLVAGGDFTASGTTPISRIAQFDGTSWTGFGTGANAIVRTVAAWDPDGDGPEHERLYVGGEFTNVNGVTISRVAQFDGTTWSRMGSGLAGSTDSSLKTSANTIVAWDPDGEGDAPQYLYVGGNFLAAGGVASCCVASWDGAAWRSIGNGVTGLWNRGRVNAISAVNFSDCDSSRNVLAIGGFFDEVGTVAAQKLAFWDGTAWSPARKGLDDWCNALTAFDADGPGGEPEYVYAGGYFIRYGGTQLNRIARWDGHTWQPLGTGLTGSALVLVPWDPDGSGPAGLQLVAGGRFTAAGGKTVLNIARWDGTAWHAIGAGFNGDVEAITTWDMDGNGPLEPRLVVGGTFTRSGTQTMNRVAMWDGTSWLALGEGFGQHRICAVGSWDADGDGPGLPVLVAGGQLTGSGSSGLLGVGAWNGTTWERIGEGFTSPSFPKVHAIVSWDSDGPGPRGTDLVIGGQFSKFGTVTASEVARWDGIAWHPIDQPLSIKGTVHSIKVIDHDNDGWDDLVMAGPMWVNDGGELTGVVRWDGTQWHSFGNGIGSDVYALTPWRDVSDPNVPPRYVVGGNLYERLPSVKIRNIALWNTRMPSITHQPTGVTTCPGGDAGFFVDAADGELFRWRRDGVLLEDGVLSSGATVRGSRTRHLCMSGVQLEDAGEFVCEHYTDGRVGQSEPAMLQVCRADFDCSGFVDTDDFTSFVLMFEIGDQSADVDGTGFVDTDDFTVYVVAFEAGC